MAEKFRAASGAARDLHLDGAFGKTEALGDLALGKAREFAEDNDLTATIGQIGDRFGDEFDFFRGGECIGGRGAILCHG